MGSRKARESVNYKNRNHCGVIRVVPDSPHGSFRNSHCGWAADTSYRPNITTCGGVLETLRQYTSLLRRQEKSCLIQPSIKQLPSRLWRPFVMRRHTHRLERTNRLNKSTTRALPTTIPFPSYSSRAAITARAMDALSILAICRTTHPSPAFYINVVRCTIHLKGISICRLAVDDDSRHRDCCIFFTSCWTCRISSSFPTPPPTTFCVIEALKSPSGERPFVTTYCPHTPHTP